MTLGARTLKVFCGVVMHAETRGGSGSRRVSFVPLPFPFNIALLLQLIDFFAV